ncbi:hypothetical protein [Helicobacter suis]|uniref:hypothetical protein n=1 Tax=Helicobacter suis TaxID=104628 RepID=UPI0013CFD08E|nr:hypothetical protein [Helicobacter suis]
MIDEAEHLPVSSLKVLCRLHDFTETPVILGGTHELLKILKRCKKHYYSATNSSMVISNHAF